MVSLCALFTLRQSNYFSPVFLNWHVCIFEEKREIILFHICLKKINLSLCLHMYMLGNENECGRTFASRKTGVTSKFNESTGNNWKKTGKYYLSV